MPVAVRTALIATALIATALIATALSSLVLAGCGSDPVDAPLPAPTAAGPTRQQLERALLTQAELPLGFHRQDGGSEPTAIGCPGIDQIYLAPDTSARVTVSFGHATSSALVSETIAVQPGTAAANLDGFRRAAQDCRAFAGAGQVRYQVAPLPGIPSYGDATAAVRITSRLREARPVDLVAIRVGDTVVLVAHADARTVDTDLTRTIVARAVGKVRRAG